MNRTAPGFLLAIVLLVALDSWALSWSALANEAILLGILALGTLATDAASRFVSRFVSPSIERRSSHLLLVGAPALYGAWNTFQNRDLLPLWGVLTLPATAAVLLLLPQLERRYLRSFQLLQAPSLLWSILLTFGLLMLHSSTGTFVSIRPGTGVLHVVLFLATWAGTYGVCCLSGLRALAPSRAAAVGLLHVLVLFASGVLLREVDRRVLVGLYPEVHAWLTVSSFLILASSLSFLWIRFGDARAFAPRLQLAAVAALVMSIPLSAFSLAMDDAERASLTSSPVGNTLVYLLPSSGPQNSGSPDHPALRFEQRLDRRLDGGPYDILLISVDALRADAVELAPNLEGLAKKSLYFSHAYAQGSRTAIGMSALMLGRYSANIDWQLLAYAKGKLLEPQELTPEKLEELGSRFVYTTLPLAAPGDMLAERLQAAGYATMAAPFAGPNHFFSKDSVFARGFDVYADLTKKKWRAPTSKAITRVVRRQLDKQRKKPWFSWVHYYDPHESRTNKKRYADLVGHFDSAFGKLLQQVELSNTIIAVTADHGEAFGEHSHTGHGSSLYQEQVLVPLILYVPGATPQRIDAPVAVIDVTATLLAAVGADTAGLDGVNLLAFLDDPVQLQSRPVFTELHRYMSNQGKRTADLKAVRLGDSKLIVDRRRRTVELFDLRADPEERVNLASSRPEQLVQLRALLDSFLFREQSLETLP